MNWLYLLVLDEYRSYSKWLMIEMNSIEMNSIGMQIAIENSMGLYHFEKHFDDILHEHFETKLVEHV